MWFELTLFIHFKKAIQKVISPCNENRKATRIGEIQTVAKKKRQNKLWVCGKQIIFLWNLRVRKKFWDVSPVFFFKRWGNGKSERFNDIFKLGAKSSPYLIPILLFFHFLTALPLLKCLSVNFEYQLLKLSDFLIASSWILKNFVNICSDLVPDMIEHASHIQILLLQQRKATVIGDSSIFENKYTIFRWSQM